VCSRSRGDRRNDPYMHEGAGRLDGGDMCGCPGRAVERLCCASLSLAVSSALSRMHLLER